MQYSPKLKKAMEEIKKVLTKHDIAGFVVIHTPGFVEYLNKIDPSYSCGFAAPDGSGLRVKLKTVDVGKERAKELATQTYNMASMLADVIGPHALAYMDFHKMLQGHWGGEDGQADWSDHVTQNQ